MDKREAALIIRPVPFAAVAFICTNKRPDGHPKSCCADKGSVQLRNTLKRMVSERGLDGKVKVYQSGCLGGCEFGPMAMTFPDGRMQFGVSEADLPAMLDSLAAEVDTAEEPA